MSALIKTNTSFTAFVSNSQKAIDFNLSRCYFRDPDLYIKVVMAVREKPEH